MIGPTPVAGAVHVKLIDVLSVIGSGGGSV